MTATCVAGTDAQSNLFMPVMPACAPAGTSTAEQDLPSQQQKQSLQLALRACNLQLETIGLNVLAQEFVEVSDDDKPKLHKMLQARMCIFQYKCLYVFWQKLTNACTCLASPAFRCLLPVIAGLGIMHIQLSLSCQSTSSASSLDAMCRSLGCVI